MRRFIPFGAIALVAMLAYVAAQSSDGREMPDDGAVGTSGVLDDRDEGGVIHELDTITGMNDGHELVGRRVDLHVPVQQHLNDVAFWVGSADNRLLVVLSRDTRDGTARQKGLPSAHGIDAEYEEQMATISGTVHTIPKAEEMLSWGLTEADHEDLMDRRIYIRADAVTPHFSATTTAYPR